jgi:hypothetical protein
VELEFLPARELEVLRTVPGVAGTRVAGFLGGVTLDGHLGAEAVADELRQLVKVIGTVVTEQATGAVEPAIRSSMLAG